MTDLVGRITDVTFYKSMQQTLTQLETDGAVLYRLATNPNDPTTGQPFPTKMGRNEKVIAVVTSLRSSSSAVVNLLLRSEAVRPLLAIHTTRAIADGATVLYQLKKEVPQTHIIAEEYVTAVVTLLLNGVGNDAEINQLHQKLATSARTLLNLIEKVRPESIVPFAKPPVSRTLERSNSLPSFNVSPRAGAGGYVGGASPGPSSSSSSSSSSRRPPEPQVGSPSKNSSAINVLDQILSGMDKATVDTARQQVPEQKKEISPLFTESEKQNLFILKSNCEKLANHIKHIVISTRLVIDDDEDDLKINAQEQQRLANEFVPTAKQLLVSIGELSNYCCYPNDVPADLVRLASDLQNVGLAFVHCSKDLFLQEQESEDVARLEQSLHDFFSLQNQLVDLAVSSVVTRIITINAPSSASSPPSVSPITIAYSPSSSSSSSSPSGPRQMAPGRGGPGQAGAGVQRGAPRSLSQVPSGTRGQRGGPNPSRGIARGVARGGAGPGAGAGAGRPSSPAQPVSRQQVPPAPSTMAPEPPRGLSPTTAHMGGQRSASVSMYQPSSSSAQRSSPPTFPDRSPTSPNRAPGGSATMSVVGKPADGARKMASTVSGPSGDQSAPKSKEETQAINRAFGLKEILDSEKTYFSALQRTIWVYKKQLQDLAKTDPNVINDKEIESLFCNIESIFSFSKSLYKDLRRLGTDPNLTVGDIFLRNAPVMRMYSIYINNYDNCNLTLMECRKRSQFNALIEANNQIAGVATDLSAFLILPVQRPPRYEMLLTVVLKNTPEDHPEYETLSLACKKIKQINDEINEEKRQADGRAYLFRIQKLLSNKPAELVIIAPHRKLIKEGIVGRINNKTKNRENRYIFLFSDLLVVSKERGSSFIYKSHTPITGDVLLTSDMATATIKLVTQKPIEDALEPLEEIWVFTSSEEMEQWASAVISVLQPLAIRSSSRT